MWVKIHEGTHLETRDWNCVSRWLTLSYISRTASGGRPSTSFMSTCTSDGCAASEVLLHCCTQWTLHVCIAHVSKTHSWHAGTSCIRLQKGHSFISYHAKPFLWSRTSPDRSRIGPRLLGSPGLIQTGDQTTDQSCPPTTGLRFWSSGFCAGLIPVLSSVLPFGGKKTKPDWTLHHYLTGMWCSPFQALRCSGALAHTAARGGCLFMQDGHGSTDRWTVLQVTGWGSPGWLWALQHCQAMHPGRGEWSQQGGDQLCGVDQAAGKVPPWAANYLPHTHHLWNWTGQLGSQGPTHHRAQHCGQMQAHQIQALC